MFSSVSSSDSPYNLARWSCVLWAPAGDRCVAGFVGRRGTRRMEMDWIVELMCCHEEVNLFNARACG